MTGRCHCHCHYHFGGSAGMSRGCHGGRAQGCRVPGSSALLRGASKRSSASHGLSIMTVERRPTRMLHRGRLGASRLQGQDALVSGLVWDVRSRASGGLPFAGLGRVRAAGSQRAGEGQIGPPARARCDLTVAACAGCWLTGEAATR
jgi:hypothetical protein